MPRSRGRRVSEACLQSTRAGEGAGRARDGRSPCCCSASSCMSIVMRLSAAALFAISSTALSFSRSSSYWLNPPPPEVPAPPEEVPPNKLLRSLGILRAAMRFFSKRKKKKKKRGLCRRVCSMLIRGVALASTPARSLPASTRRAVRSRPSGSPEWLGTTWRARRTTRRTEIPVRFRVRKKGKVVACRCLGPSKTELALCALFVYCGICATGKG